MNVKNAHIQTQHRLRRSKEKERILWYVEPIALTVEKTTRLRWRSIPHPDPTRHTFLSKHHDKAIKRKGTMSIDNIIMLWYDKHSAWHRLFGLMTLSEIITTVKSKKWKLFNYKLDDWYFVFKYKTKYEVVDLLYRLKRAKIAQRK